MRKVAGCVSEYQAEEELGEVTGGIEEGLCVQR